MTKGDSPPLSEKSPLKIFTGGHSPPKIYTLICALFILNTVKIIWRTKDNVLYNNQIDLCNRDITTNEATPNRLKLKIKCQLAYWKFLFWRTGRRFVDGDI